MTFLDALDVMMKGGKVKLPTWTGYWTWDYSQDTIIMHCKDGVDMDIRSTDRVYYTASNMASDQWVIADQNNTPILGGTALFSFGDAVRMMQRGLSVTRAKWPHKTTHARIERPEPCTNMIQPYIYREYIKTDEDGYRAIKCRIPWSPSNDDILAMDWYIVD